MKDNLGDRIKSNYEDSYRFFLPRRLPLILRIDGKGFHKYTKGCDRPFDQKLIDCIDDTALYLCKNVQGCKISYQQSDEISLLITNDDNLDTQSYFNNNLQKVVSVTAGMASAYFTSISDKIFGKIKLAAFDCRAFIVPEREVNNTFLWRQQDATRNSVQMVARSLYSHKECTDKNNSQLQEMIFQKGINWNDLSASYKRGRCCLKQDAVSNVINKKTGDMISCVRSQWVIDNNIPIFSKDINYIEKYLNKSVTV